MILAEDAFQWRRRPAVYPIPSEGADEADDAGDKLDRMRVRCIRFWVFPPHAQNCPRLTDKLLGQLGAARRVQRAEVDEIDADAGDVSKDLSDAVAKVIQSRALRRTCEWTQPGHDPRQARRDARRRGQWRSAALCSSAMAAAAAVYFVKFAWVSLTRALFHAGKMLMNYAPVCHTFCAPGVVVRDRVLTTWYSPLFDPCTPQNHSGRPRWVPVLAPCPRPPRPRSPVQQLSARRPRPPDTGASAAHRIVRRARGGCRRDRGCSRSPRTSNTATARRTAGRRSTSTRVRGSGSSSLVRGDGLRRREGLYPTASAGMASRSAPRRRRGFRSRRRPGRLVLSCEAAARERWASPAALASQRPSGEGFVLCGSADSSLCEDLNDEERVEGACADL